MSLPGKTVRHPFIRKPLKNHHSGTGRNDGLDTTAVNLFRGSLALAATHFDAVFKESSLEMCNVYCHESNPNAARAILI